MSDGPHKSLKMRPAWKKLAEYADKEAFAAEEVGDALSEALERDWRAEIPESLRRQVQTILHDDQDDLFCNQRALKLEALMSLTSGYPFATIFIEYAIQAAEKGLSGDEAVQEATSYALTDRAKRGARQVEEHYHRKSTVRRATHVRERIKQGFAKADLGGITNRLIGVDRRGRAQPIAKQTGLDDGVGL